MSHEDLHALLMCLSALRDYNDWHELEDSEDPPPDLAWSIQIAADAARVLRKLERQ